ncbi:hypothetical protein RJ640_021764 [Escallonia rubra]|uniref:UvrD-like helicase ATP-binding domain-containing protein n=1 Tax=Escallonia rubra TaxID=112253 RepID=A0AA88UCY1_9ASTE|nr:hypothetical protein RJ640_021764 [Escallonia rubra]
MFCRNQLMHEEQHIPEFEVSKVQSKSFLEFARDRYKFAAPALKRCVSILCTHVPKSIILEHNFQHMVSLVALLDSFETLLFRDSLASEELEVVFTNQWVVETPAHDLPEKSTLAYIRSECLRVLTSLFRSLDGLKLPSVTNKDSIVDFCFQAASSIFCTASSSYRLLSVAMDPIRLLVIDEAAQLKECESTVPLQLPCIKHAILIGDECQLPAMISSTGSSKVYCGDILEMAGRPMILVSEKAGFGRSLFERLSLLGHSKHLLSTQYRMHPSISCFPNAKFYQNRITDAPIVKNKSYERRYLSGPMYGPFSFINISGGKEVLDDGNSLKNFVEIAVVLKLLELLYKAIQHKLGQKYENHGSFRVKVGTIDGFQGVEEDVIIISTVLFSDNFRKSFSKLKSVETKNLSLLLLSKLSSGWRPKRNVGISCESSSNILRKFKVGELYIVCSVDIVKESWFIQALKVWDILPLQDISKLVKRLDNIFSMYTDDYLTRCRVKLLEGNLEVPMRWAPSSHIVQYKSLSNRGNVEPIDAGAVDGKSYVENSTVRDSLLLMKFYSLSSGAVSNLLSSCNGGDGLPFELTEQEQEIVLFDKSTFVLGRSGTGKTTVLTMKLFRNEQLYHISSEGFHEVTSHPSNDVGWRYEVSKSDGEAKGDILRQLFVTVSPKLCYAVKRHVSQWKRSVCGGSSSTDSDSMHMNEIEDTAQFTDIPDTFVDLSPKAYPLIITFRKFLLMLDGTVGTSYFERFRDVRQTCQGISSMSRSVILEAFIRNNEVNYDRFCSSYWPHFNIRLTKILDPSMVFTEIMSVIKGGLRIGDSHDGRLCQQDYVSISEDRGSTLSMQKREVVYEIFLEYEKKKVEYGDFDIADLVIDLHKRFKDEVFEGDVMDFVYIDEVQDLSMRQISLFKYICRNVDEGFVFSGDTAQTIARGIDFRFEDIRCLFYNEFVFGSRGCATDRRSAKGRVSKIHHLSRNFRTHAGVLKLGESVLSLIYHFFRSSVDILSPESSLLFGEAPILLNIGSNINLMTILESSGKAGDVVGFGAEQVILVRDECMKKEIAEYVGKRALVLTIMECKGLEFQDVLLYNFFTSSPFQDEWRVIYGYMEEKDMLKSSPKHFTSFSWEKHSVLCSEMKNLYVAITRTKQRLWIWENAGFSQPIFDYWKNSYLVEERQVDDAFIQEMQVASNQEEWKSRGIKLYYENNYEAAMVCFERAGDAYWQKMAKASGLRAAAARMHAPNSDTWRKYLKEAAEIFYSIDIFEASAQCYFEINEYKMAGTIYQQKFGESKLEKAGECFSLAKCHKLAAEACARARSYSKCLSACIDGKLFEMGLLYIRSWKEQTTFHADKLMEAHRSIEDFLQTGALHYYELKDKRTMMGFVKSFHSGDTMRNFLRKLDCLDELLSLEIESGNFLAAADIAKLKQDHVLEADFFEKAGLFREASMLILWHVFTNILHPKTGKGKPSNQFMQKKGLLTKAKLIAKNHSDLFYEFVSTEAEILSKGITAGELLEMELEFIVHWKSRAPSDLCRIIKTSHELNKMEQYLLEKCARHYYALKDKRTMMNYVKKFDSVTLIREFLKGLNCLEELMLHEEELGNFLEAAEIAEQKRDILRKADLLEKAGQFKDASLSILWYVLPRSLWAPKSEGWPLKQFHPKDKLLAKAILCAKNLPDPLCSFFCMEATILSNKESSLSEMRKYLSASQDQKSLRCEILTAWKVLDAHFNVATSKYEWNASLVDNLNKHSEDMISENQVSIETLVHFWNHWKEKIVGLIDYLLGNITRDVSDYARCEEFCLNYFGLQKHFLNKDNVYIVLFSDANWLKIFDPRILRRNGDLVFIESRPFVSAALSYWYSVLHSVGIQVLVTLNALHLYSIKSHISMFLQSKCLLYIFGTANFLLNFKFPNRKYYDVSNVQKHLELSVKNLLGNVFHVDWRSSLTNDMIFLRGKASCVDLLKEAISQSIFSRDKLTFGQLGRVVMMILGSPKGTVNLHEDIMRSNGGNSVFWGEFTKMLSDKTGSDLSHGSANTGSSDASNGIFLGWLHKMLKDAFVADWRKECDYISPSCFMYLVERLLILASCFQGSVFTTKSSFVEWLIFEEWNVNSSSLLANDPEQSRIVGDIHDFTAFLVQQLLLNKRDKLGWIRKSYDGNDNYYPLLVLRLVVLLCLVCVSSGKHLDKLYRLLEKRDVSSQLPRAFCDALGRRHGRSFIAALADALGRIENPLVIVSLTGKTVVSPSPDAIFLNMKANMSSENIFRELFQEKGEAATCSGDHGNDFQVVQPNPSCVVEQLSPRQDGKNLIIEANDSLDLPKQLSLALGIREFRSQGSLKGFESPLSNFVISRKRHKVVCTLVFDGGNWHNENCGKTSDYDDSDELRSLTSMSEDEVDKDKRSCVQFNPEVDMSRPKFSVGQLFANAGEEKQCNFWPTMCNRRCKYSNFKPRSKTYNKTIS